VALNDLGADRTRVEAAGAAGRDSGRRVIAGEYDERLSVLNLTADDLPERMSQVVGARELVRTVFSHVT
jgi:hypothetical protein